MRDPMMRQKQLAEALALAVILGLIGLFSVWAQEPFLVPSLGSAAFVQVFMATERSAEPYSTGVGQLIGVAGGLIGVYVAGVAQASTFMDHNPLLYGRVLAVVIAIFVTAFGQRLATATSAAGGATAMLLTLGAEQSNWPGIGRLVAGIISVTVLGEIARRAMLAMNKPQPQ